MIEASGVGEVRRQDSFVFEVTNRCNFDCLHCYNAWKNPGCSAAGELPTAETLDMLSKMLDETGASLVSLSGGEPMLRADIYEIVDFLVGRGVTVNLISNGSLLDESAAGRLSPDKISIFELPLLSVERKIHDQMSGFTGAFDLSTLAAANLKAAGQRVVCVFVATLLNLQTWRETAELAIALGADGIMFNRFNPGGKGAENIEALQASPQQLSEALDIAQEVAEHYQIPISCSIAMPPCLFDHSRWPNLGFGFCAAGTERAYYTLDPIGNMRPCNHSATVIGNIREQGFWDMVDSYKMKEFVAASPVFCSGCRLEKQCLGGCKASAEVCYGSLSKLDPFMNAFSSQASKPLR